MGEPLALCQGSYTTSITLIVLELINVKWRVILELDPETNDWAVWCPELPGCASASGSTREYSGGYRFILLSHLQAGTITCDVTV